MSQKEIQIGVIGAGAIARRAHLPAWRSLRDSLALRVTAIADTSAVAVAEAAEEFGIPASYTSYEELLADPAIDVVDICAPTPAHHEIGMKALRAGKHVLMEKPMVLSLAEALDLYRAAQDSGRVLSVVQNYRYMDATKRASERVAMGNLGAVNSIHANALTRFPSTWTVGTWLYHPRAVLYDFTPHVIDLLLYLHKSRPRRVIATGRTLPDADFLVAAQALIEFEDGSTALLDCAWVTSVFKFALDMHGSGCSIHLEPMQGIFHESVANTTPLDATLDFARDTWGTVFGTLSGRHYAKPLNAYLGFFTDFVAALRAGTPPPVTAEEGLWVNVVLEACWHSIQTGQPVELKEFLDTFETQHSRQSGELSPAFR
jgi:predicted dehydrogenase